MFSNILRIWYDELQTVRHSFGLIIFCLLVPLAYPLLYAFVYTQETVREVPVAVVDECHSSLSREFYRKVDATSDVAILYHCDLAQAQELMRQEKVYAIMRIPSTFERDITRGDQTFVALYSDMRSMLYYKAALLAASNVSIEMNADIRVDRHLHGSTDQQDAVIKAPVTNSYVALYNPQSGIASFLIPCVLMAIIQQLLFLSIGTSMGMCRERNGGVGIPQGQPWYDSALSIVLGKALFYVPLFFLIGVYMYSGVTDIFSLLRLADYTTFLRFLLPYVLACTFMGIAMSSFIHRGEDSMLLYIFMSVPLLFLSGMSWPVAAEPMFWRCFSWVFPSTFGMHGYARLMGTGASLDQISFEYHGLWIQALVYLLLAVWVYRRELRRSRANALSITDKT